MDDTLDLALRVVHIGFGVFWAGAAVMLAAFIEPAIKALGPDGGRFMERMVGPGRFGLFMSSSGALTAATGVVMLFTESGGGLGTWLSSGYGLSIVVGSILGLLAFAAGIGLNAPASIKLAKLAETIGRSGGPPSPEQIGQMKELQERLHRVGILAAVLAMGSVIAMAAAHYL